MIIKYQDYIVNTDNVFDIVLSTDGSNNREKNTLVFLGHSHVCQWNFSSAEEALKVRNRIWEDWKSGFVWDLDLDVPQEQE